MSVGRDVRYAARVLFRDKWFTVAATLALGLGIGVNTTVFTLVNAILLRDLPFEEPEEIMFVTTRNEQGQNLGVSLPDFEDIAETSRSFESIGLWQGGVFNLSDDEAAPESYAGNYISANVFEMLAVEPVLGRNFLAEDDRPGAPPVALIGHGVWESRYAGDPSVLGRTIRLSSVRPTIIGVMPEGMQFPFNSEVWVPAVHMPPGLRIDARGARNFPVFARLADGVSTGQANAELQAIAAGLSAEYVDTNAEMTFVAMPFTELVAGDEISLIIWSLMGAVGFVLLIACANVANLQLARSVRRTQEVGVRVSLGAGRWRIVRQLLVESVVLAFAGGILGLGLAFLGIRFADMAFADVGVPFWMTFTMDANVFGFLALICLGTGIVFGLAPALQASRTDVNGILKEGGRSGGGGVRSRWWAGILVTAELALTLILLAGAGYMMRSFLVLYRLDLGIDAAPLLTAQVVLPDLQYPTPDLQAVFFERAEDRLRENPAIEAATFTTNPPLGGGAARQVEIDGQTPPPEETAATVTTVAIGTRYFETLGLDLGAGRPFTRQDGEPGYGSAIVNERFAFLYFPNQDPIGQAIRLTVPNAEEPPPWLTVVGVAPNVRQGNIEERQPDPVVYLPYRTHTQLGHMLIVRSRADTGTLSQTLRDDMRALDPDLPLSNVMTMESRLAQTRWPFRIFGSMFAIFAFIALVLSAVGLYAVTAYSVSQRTEEIGIRMALGAQPRDVWWLVARQAALQLGIGMVVGMAGAAAVGRLLESLLVQIGPADPVTLVSIAGVLAIVAVLAFSWPSVRAARLHPSRALRRQ